MSFKKKKEQVYTLPPSARYKTYKTDKTEIV